MAALLDGKHVRGLDQTGCPRRAARWSPTCGSPREPLALGEQGARPAAWTCYLGFDLLGARRPNLSTADPRRTRRGGLHERGADRQDGDRPGGALPRLAGQLDRIDARHAPRAQRLPRRSAALRAPVRRPHAGQHARARRGLPARPAAGVGRSDRAGDPPQRRGRREEPRGVRAGAAPSWPTPTRSSARTAEPEPPAPELLRGASASWSTLAVDGDARRAAPAPGDPRARADRLPGAPPTRAATPSSCAASRWPSRSWRPARGELAEAVARNLFKLMAYKDEYEVARLHLDASSAPGCATSWARAPRVWFKLHPPLLRALGLKRKLKLGRWFVPAFRAPARDAPPARHAARPVRPRARAPRRARS